MIMGQLLIMVRRFRKNKIEMDAYGKALGKVLGAAGKAIYKATKGIEDKEE